MGEYEERAERALAAAGSLFRLAWIAGLVGNVRTHSPSYRYRRLGIAAFAATAASSPVFAWLARPRSGRERARSGLVYGDVALACAASIVSAPACRGTGNWALDYPVAVAVTAAIDGRAGPAVGALVVLPIVQAVAGWSGAPLPERLQLVGRWLNYAGTYAIVALQARWARDVARELDAQTNRAVARAEALAEETERRRIQRQVHDGALQTLEAVAAGWDVDPAILTARARADAERLRALEARDDARVPVAFELDLLVDEFAGRGLDVRVDADDDRDIPAAAIDAIRELLTNTAKHAGVDRADVEVTAAGALTTIVVSDRGRGFDAGGGVGFGLRESVRARLAGVGGAVRIESGEAGTRVTLEIPADGGEP